jgi:hypothetical protein
MYMCLYIRISRTGDSLERGREEAGRESTTRKERRNWASTGLRERDRERGGEGGRGRERDGGREGGERREEEEVGPSSPSFEMGGDGVDKGNRRGGRRQ